MSQTPKTSKILLVIIIVLVVAVLGWMAFFIWGSNDNSKTTATKSPIPTKLAVSPTTSLKISSSPTTSPTSKTTPNIYQVPVGETYIMSSEEDTNGDGENETLVITEINDGLYHAYILSADKSSILYDNKELTQKPVRISTQVYGTGETYSSWMLVFTEQSGNLAFIHWNGTEYEIPESLGI